MDMDALINLIGRKVFGDMADTLEGAIEEGQELLDEARSYTAAMREVAPIFSNKLCPKCGEKLGRNHVCEEGADVIDTDAKSEGEGEGEGEG